MAAMVTVTASATPRAAFARVSARFPRVSAAASRVGPSLDARRRVAAVALRSRRGDALRRPAAAGDVVEVD